MRAAPQASGGDATRPTVATVPDPAGVAESSATSPDGRADAAPAEPLAEPAPPAHELRHRRRNVLADLDWVSLVYVAVGVLLAWALFGLFRVATDALTKIAVGVVLAFAFDPIVGKLQARFRWPRGAAVAVVCSGLLVTFAGVVVLLGPPAVGQAARFGRELPETVEDLYGFPIVGNRLEEAQAAREVNRWLDDLPGSVSTATVTDLAERLVGGLASVVQVVLVTFAVLLDGELLVSRFRRLVPRRHRERADRVGRIFYATLGRYFAGSLLLAVMNGLYILTVGLVLGVPLAPLAAVWVMLTNLVPQVGGFLGGSVFVTLALTAGAATGVVALGLFVLYMSSENYLIQPAVVGTAVNLSPPATMLAAFVGAATAGVPGALVATPLLGAAKAMYTEFRFGPEPEERRRRPKVPGLGALRRLLGRRGGG